MTKVSISRQRKAVDLSIGQLRIAAAARKLAMPAREVEYIIDGLLATIGTLEFVEQHEAEIREWMSEKKARAAE